MNEQGRDRGHAGNIGDGSVGFERQVWEARDCPPTKGASVFRLLSFAVVLTACGPGAPAPQTAPTPEIAEPAGPPPYEAETFRASFPEAAPELFISSAGSRGELLPAHVEQFLGQPAEDGATFAPVAVVPMGGQSVFVLRQQGGSGPADIVAVVGDAVQSVTVAKFGQKSWIEPDGVLRIQTASFPEGAQAPVLTQAYYDLDPTAGHVARR